MFLLQGFYYFWGYKGWLKLHIGVNDFIDLGYEWVIVRKLFDKY